MIKSSPEIFESAICIDECTNILRIEDYVTTSFYALACLRNFRYVMDKCAYIELLTRNIESLHKLLNKHNAGQAIFSDSSKSDSSDESCVDGENCNTDANRDKSFHV